MIEVGNVVETPLVVILGCLVTGTLHGPELSWHAWSAVFWAACVVIGYLKIDLSAMITTALLFLELFVVAIFDVAVVAKGGGPSGIASPTWTVPPHYKRSGT